MFVIYIALAVIAMIACFLVLGLTSDSAWIAYLIVALACFGGAVYGMSAASHQTHARYAHRDRAAATRLLSAGVSSERRFYAAHGYYGTVSVDLAMSDPAFVRRLNRSDKLTAVLGENGSAIRLTARVNSQQVSTLLAPGQ